MTVYILRADISKFQNSNVSFKKVKLAKELEFISSMPFPLKECLRG
jgi:hypothetical protein